VAKGNLNPATQMTTQERDHS